jgi:hypothetical protein
MLDRRRCISAILCASALACGAAAADLGPDLLIAARKGQAKQVSDLLSRGASIETAGKDGRTPLMLAAMRGHAETVKLLLERGAKTDARDRQGWTAYALALTNGRDEIVRLLPHPGPLAVEIQASWAPDNVYSSCSLAPPQLQDYIAGLQLDAVAAAALREYAAAGGKAAVVFDAPDPQAALVLKVRPGVSCLQQQTRDNISLAIDVKLVRHRDHGVLLEKTYGGGLKGLHSRSASSPAQYAALFADWAKTHAPQIYWAMVEAWLRAP